MPNIKKNVILAPYTTFKIGGPAKYFAVVNSTKEIIECAKWAKEKKLPILVLGGGSNVLISDKGFNGLVIKFQVSPASPSEAGRASFRIQGDRIVVDAGVPLAKVVAEATNTGLSGLEWAVGIPGTVGGAINGNAGAFGKSISSAVEKVEVFDAAKLKTRTLKNKECKFSYRNSFFSVKGLATASASGGKRNPNLIILSAIIHLEKGNHNEMRKVIKDYIHERLESNPSGFSAGCFFKNPGWEEIGNKNEIIAEFPELEQFSEKPKISAGFLIDCLGLRGKKIGDAAVSEKHANFILNNGTAEAKDVIDLVNLIKEKIRKRYGFDLEDEVVVVK